MKKVGLLFLIIGLIFVAIGVFVVKNSQSVKKWPATKGVVIESKVVSHFDSESNHSMYAPAITYTYEVGGKQYQNSDYAFVNISYSDPSKAEEIVKKFPPGKKVIVYYNPENPYKAVLTKNSSLMIYIPAVLGIVFAIVGMGLILVG